MQSWQGEYCLFAFCRHGGRYFDETRFEGKTESIQNSYLWQMTILICGALAMLLQQVQEGVLTVWP